ncbi:unnamed protein product, partial [Rotaria socialis]
HTNSFQQSNHIAMPVSKLELLPNEILTDLFEKYMTGSDIAVGFANLQNQRFNSHISQCRRFYFDFFICRKDHFTLAPRRLPVHLE